jgi:predicted alpha/beta-fold hydrolase
MELHYNNENAFISEFAKKIKEKNIFHCANLLSFISFSDGLHLFATLGFIFRRKSLFENILYNKHEKIKLADGGTVCFTQYSPSVMSANAPIVFILETFSGNGKILEPLIYVLVQKLKWSVVVFRRRGVHCPLTSPVEHVVGCDEDVKHAIELIHERNPFSKIFCLGISAGGTILARFLGKYQPKYVTGAATISSGLHTGMFDGMHDIIGNTMLSDARARIKNFASENKLGEKTLLIYKQLRSCGGNVRKYAEIESNLYEENTDDFFEKHMVQNWVPRIKVPFLAINAMDDKICMNPQYYTDILKENPVGIYIITKHGGHCAFPSTHNLLYELNWAEHVSILFFQYMI